MSKSQVAERVKHGGHNIPINAIERRFSRSLHNLFNDFSHQVNNCVCFINTSDKPTLVFEQPKKHRIISNEAVYKSLLSKSEL